MTKVDLHIHTCASDGTWTAEEVVKEVRQKNIKVFAITDHDTVENSVKAMQFVNDDLNLIVGVEVSCTYMGKEFHVLAYDFDIDDVALNELINWNKDTRINYNKRLVEYVNTRGLLKSIADYDSYTYDKRLGGWKALHYLMDKDIVKDFWDVLRFQEQCEEVLEFKSPKAVIEVIKNAGGYAVLAHPSSYYKGEKLTVDIMDQFISFGIDGLECYSPYLKEVNDASYYKDYCLTHGIGITAGSDCHGTFSNRTLGQPQASIKDVDLKFMNIK